ncbi:preprotein translocase subunit SecE [Methyloceanibacter marginalis]|uniref:Preprotein translocase subunit SecE n=1 Tax=Methyloceanibacter marginalis TaxID=1774971 RepID=A0A1E3WAM0_9HYPH|nr:preprotein translocase subunit SecE [Methyloceanibacter marginalis]
MARTNPFEFLQQVRTEVSKVTWPTRRETVITTFMVLLMSFAAALFFLGWTGCWAWSFSSSWV